jgi:hypothetical protein
MSQQFRIESESLRDKLNNLLPSQNRGAIGVELSGSTQIVPIIDLTETAEGSGLRQDLQTSLSLTSITAFSVTNTTTTLVNTTGYYRVFGNVNGGTSTGSSRTAKFSLTDGLTTKIIQTFTYPASSTANIQIELLDFIVFLKAGDSLTATTSAPQTILSGNTRQIADISGNLTNPL